jgi:hypothetical protein
LLQISDDSSDTHEGEEDDDYDPDESDDESQDYFSAMLAAQRDGRDRVTRSVTRARTSTTMFHEPPAQVPNPEERQSRTSTNRTSASSSSFAAPVTQTVTTVASQRQHSGGNSNNSSRNNPVSPNENDTNSILDTNRLVINGLGFSAPFPYRPEYLQFKENRYRTVILPDVSFGEFAHARDFATKVDKYIGDHPEIMEKQNQLITRTRLYNLAVLAKIETFMTEKCDTLYLELEHDRNEINAMMHPFVATVCYLMSDGKLDCVKGGPVIAWAGAPHVAYLQVKYCESATSPPEMGYIGRTEEVQRSTRIQAAMIFDAFDAVHMLAIEIVHGMDKLTEYCDYKKSQKSRTTLQEVSDNTGHWKTSETLVDGGDDEINQLIVHEHILYARARVNNDPEALKRTTKYDAALVHQPHRQPESRNLHNPAYELPMRPEPKEGDDPRGRYMVERKKLQDVPYRSLLTDEYWTTHPLMPRFDISTHSRAFDTKTNSFLPLDDEDVGDGYSRYTFVDDDKDSRQRGWTAGRAALSAFTELRESNLEADHVTGDYKQEELKYMAWVTSSQNTVNRDIGAKNTSAGRTGIIAGAKVHGRYTVARVGTANNGKDQIHGGRTLYIGVGVILRIAFENIYWMSHPREKTLLGCTEVRKYGDERESR